MNDLSFDSLPLKTVYGAQVQSSELINSTSGGAFWALARYFVKNRGYVFGCAFDENLTAKHICVNSLDGIAKIQGSKYIASELGNTFALVKQKLLEHCLVLFSGTPCQIAGLRTFLGDNYDNLLLVDIVCHGTPSGKLFDKYIKWLECKWDTQVVDYRFRDKRVSSWGKPQKVRITTTKGVKVVPSICDPYFKAFQKGITFRKSCYSCKYASTARVGDITIADFWGIANFYPEFPKEKGASLILLNTEKGISFFSKIKNDFLLVESNLSSAVANNPHLKAPVAFNPVRDEIYSALSNEYKFALIVRKYLKPDSFLKYNFIFFGSLIKRIGKKILNNI